MGWETNVNLIQKLYIAFYGRPADPGGLRYWASQLPDNAAPDSQAVRELINSFINSAEAQTRFGSPTDLNVVIDRIYNFAFHRNATGAEKAAFAGKTVVDVLVSVLSVSSGPDYASLNNKLQYANWFWEYIDSSKDGLPNDDSTGTKFAATFAGTKDANDIASKLNFIDSANPPVQSKVLDDVKSIADPGDDILNETYGKTFVLTPAIDNLAGTAYDDTFIGDRANGTALQTVQAGDQLDGKGGNDVLRLYGFTGTPAIIPSITNIETVEFVGGAPTTLNVRVNTDVKTVRVRDISGLNNKVSANILSSQTLEVVNVKIGGTTKFIQPNVSGSSVANVVVNDVHERVNANKTAVTNLAINVTAGLTTLNITATGASSDLTVWGLGGGDKLNIKGDKDIVVTFDAIADNVFIDASGNSANVTLRFENVDYSPISDGRLKGVDKIALISTALRNLDLANQTEGFDITGSVVNDTIKLGSGVNTVNAGKGNDIIVSQGTGNTLTGGAGNDIFTFVGFSDADKITDFYSSDDDIRLDLSKNFVGTKRVTGTTKVRVLKTGGGTKTYAINLSSTTAMALTSAALFKAKNTAKLISAVIAAATGGANNDFAIAFGRTTAQNKLYIVFLKDTNTGAAGGAMFSKIVTVADVGNGFNNTDIAIF